MKVRLLEVTRNVRNNLHSVKVQLIKGPPWYRPWTKPEITEREYYTTYGHVWTTTFGNRVYIELECALGDIYKAYEHQVKLLGSENVVLESCEAVVSLF